MTHGSTKKQNYEKCTLLIKWVVLLEYSLLSHSKGKKPPSLTSYVSIHCIQFEKR